LGALGRRCADGASGLLPDRCSRAIGTLALGETHARQPQPLRHPWGAVDRAERGLDPFATLGCSIFLRHPYLPKGGEGGQDAMVNYCVGVFPRLPNLPQGAARASRAGCPRQGRQRRFTFVPLIYRPRALISKRRAKLAGPVTH